MKTGVFAFVAVASLMAVSGAMAADLYIPPPPAPAPTFAWDGSYVGAKIGGGTGSEGDDLSTLTFLLPTADSFGLSGFNAGVYAGYNWDLNGLIFGVEGDLDYAGLSGSHPFGYNIRAEGPPGIVGLDAAPPDYTGTLALSTDWQAFAKARIGLPLDRALLYVTAGIGAAHATLTATADPEADDDFFPQGGSSSNIHIGGLIGVGAEYALTDQLVGRAEVDFSGFGAKSYQVGDFGPVNASWTQTTATVGLSLKF